MVSDKDEIRVEASPEILEVHSDSIEIEIRGEIPEGYLEERAHIRFEPTLHYQDQTYPIDEYVVGGEEHDEDVEVDETMAEDRGGSFTIQDKFAYDPDMKVSELCMVLNIRLDDDYEALRKCHTTERDTLASGTRTVATTVQQTDNLMFVGQKEPEVLTHDAKIEFDIERTRIRDSEKEGESMENLWDFTETPELFLNRINIDAYASPDGPTDLNEELSIGREDNSFDYLKSELLDRTFEEVHDTDFYKEATTEDWEGFMAAVRADQEVPERDWVLQVLESDKSLDEQEEELKENEEVWEYLADEILPPLRRADISLEGQIAMRDEPQVMEIGDEEPDSLNNRELLVYAHNQETLAEELEVHEYYADRFEDDYVGYGNLARMHMEIYRNEGDEEHFQQAQEYCEQAFDHADEDKVALLNNCGVWERWNGNYEKAYDNFVEAQQKGADVEYNLGIAHTNLAQYDDAVNSFPADKCDYNTALAYLLNGEEEQALEEIDCIADKDGSDFYLRAVIAARQGDEELLSTSLTRAIEENENYREMAEDDIEFSGYRDTQLYREAVN